MWIRSQSLAVLVKANEICIEDKTKIWAGCSFIGEYSTEEKALKVLDRIEELIENQCGLTFYMPTDDEVKV